MREMLKRFCMAAVMAVLGILLAVGPGSTAWGAAITVAKIGATEYKSVQEALDAAQDGDTVVLLADIDATASNLYSDGRIPIGKSIVIDGQTHTITVANRGFGVGVGAASPIDVTFKDVTILNNSAYGRCVDTRGSLNSLTLDNAKLLVPNDATQPLTIGGNQAVAAAVTIRNGSVVQTMDDGSKGYAIITFNPVNMTITESTIKGWACIYAKGPDGSAGSAGSVFTIANSTLVSKNVYSGTSNAFSMLTAEDDNVTFNVTGTEIDINATGDQSQAIVATGGETTNVKANLGEGNTVTLSGNATFALDEDTLEVSGGSFNVAVPEEVCADGYIPAAQDPETGLYTVKQGSYVARNATTAQGYETLAAAIAAAQDGDTVTLLDDCSGSGIVVPQGKFATDGLTVDFKNFTYTVDSDPLAGSTGTQNQCFQLLKDNKITFKDGAIVADSANIQMIIQNYSDLVLNNMTLDATQGSNSVAYVVSTNNGSTTIAGSTITAKAGGIAFDACTGWGGYLANSVSLTGNSTVTGDVEVSYYYGSGSTPTVLTLVSGSITGDLVMADGAVDSTVLKADTFGQAAPAEYVWVASEQEGYQTLASAVAKIGSAYYATLEAAVADAQDGDTVEVLRDDNVSLTSGGKIEIDKSITITGAVDANGEPLYTIYGTPARTGTNDIFIKGSGTVTISNLKIEGFGYDHATDISHAPIYVSSNFAGTVNLDNVHISKFNRGGLFLYGGEFNVTDSYIDCANSRSGAFTKGIEIKGSAHGTIKDTVIVNMERSGTTYSSAGIEVYGSGTITVDGCTIISDVDPHQSAKATYGIVIAKVGDYDPSGGALQVNNCSIDVSNAALSVDETYTVVVGGEETYFGNYIATWSSGRKITINEGEFTEDVYADAGTITITGGTFNNFAPDTGTGTIAISGGNFDDEVPEEYCAEGYIPVLTPDSDGYYTVKRGSYVARNAATAQGYETLAEAVAAAVEDDVIDIVGDYGEEAIPAGWILDETNDRLLRATAAIGDKLYASVQEAFDDAAAGDTVTLLKNTTEYPLYVGADCALDLNGFALTGVILPNFDFTVVDTYVDAENGANLGSIQLPALADGEDVEGDTDLDGAIWAWDGATVTVAGGTYSDPAVVLWTEGASVVIEGGVFNDSAVVPDSETCAAATRKNRWDVDAVITVTGGEFNGDYLLGTHQYAKGATLNIEGGWFTAADAWRQQMIDSGAVSVSGGWFAQEPQFLADGYLAAENTDEETSAAYPWTVAAVIRTATITSIVVNDADGSANITVALENWKSGTAVKLWAKVGYTDNYWSQVDEKTGTGGEVTFTRVPMSYNTVYTATGEDVTSGLFVQGGNVVGTLAVTLGTAASSTLGSRTYIGVPYTSWDSEADTITLGELFQANTLKAGDKISTLTAGGGVVDTFEWDGAGWSSEDDPEVGGETQFSPGTALLFIRTTALADGTYGAIRINGEIKGTLDAVWDSDMSAALAKGANMIANTSPTAVDVSAITPINANDRIMYTDETGYTYNLSWSSQGGWCYSATQVVDWERVTTTTYGLTIPAGAAFRYMRMK